MNQRRKTRRKVIAGAAGGVVVGAYGFGAWLIGADWPLALLRILFNR